MRFYFIPRKLEKVRNLTIPKVDKIKENFVYGWWEYKLVPL